MTTKGKKSLRRAAPFLSIRQPAHSEKPPPPHPPSRFLWSRTPCPRPWPPSLWTLAHQGNAGLVSVPLRSLVVPGWPRSRPRKTMRFARGGAGLPHHSSPLLHSSVCPRAALWSRGSAWPRSRQGGWGARRVTARVAPCGGPALCVCVSALASHPSPSVGSAGRQKYQKNTTNHGIHPPIQRHPTTQVA